MAKQQSFLVSNIIMSLYLGALSFYLFYDFFTYHLDSSTPSKYPGATLSPFSASKAHYHS